MTGFGVPLKWVIFEHPFLEQGGHQSGTFAASIMKGVLKKGSKKGTPK